MGVRANDEGDTPVDEMSEGLLLARRLGVDVYHRGVAAGAERTGFEFAIVWLRADGETPSFAAARVKPRSPATATKAERSPRLARLIHEILS